MSNEDIWKEIQNSMAIEGWEISDDELARIQKKYEKSNQKEILEKVLAEIGIDASFQQHKAVWERVSKACGL